MHSSLHQQSFSESHAWSDRGQESEQEEDEASPATIHLPHIVAVANRRRKGGHKQGKHAGPALQLPKLATNSQTIMARNSAHAGLGSPDGHHHLSHLQRRPKSHPRFRHPHSPSRPFSHPPSNNAHASPRSSLQLQLQQQDASPAYVPPLSPVPSALRPPDGQVNAEAREAKGLMQASSAAAALRGAAQPGAGERGDGTAQAPVSSMTAAAAAAGAEGPSGEIGGTAGGAEVDDIDALLAAIGADMEQPGDNGGAAARLESLPCTLCTSATGEVYMVGLSDVQYMLHKRKLGAEGLAILQRFENSVVQPLDALALKRGLTKDAHRPPMVSIQVPPSPSKASPTHQGSAEAAGDEEPSPQRALQRFNTSMKSSKKSRSLASGELSESRMHRSSSAGGGDGMPRGQTDGGPEASGADGNNMDEDELDEEVRRHLEYVMELVEQHRLHLHYNNARTLAEQERATASHNQALRTQAAIDFIVKRLVPEKFIAMARTRRSRAPKGGVAGAKSSGLRRRANLGSSRASSPELGPRPVQPPPSTQGPAPSTGQSPPRQSSMGEGKEEGVQKSPEPSPKVPPAQEGSGRKWVVAADKVTMDKMPFMPAWGATIKKLKKEDGVGWDEMMGGNQNSLQGGGVQIYVIKCQELGVIPSTQVVQQLRQAECAMGHCQLGRRGAQALRHALAVNTSITDLNLMDNGLDAQGLAEIVTGLTYGFTARKPREGVGSQPQQSMSLDLVKHVPHSADVAVNVLPPSLRSQAGGGMLKAQSGQPAPGPSQVGGAPGGQARGPPVTFGSKKTSAPAERRGSPTGPKSPSRSRSQSPTKTRRQNRVPIEPHRSNVQILDLSMNPLGMNGGRLIAELLDPQQTPHQFLVELRLDKCGLAEASGLAIVKALQNFNRTLQVLSMSNNALSNKTAAAFGELLKENTTLTDLDLSWNQIKAEGVKGLRPGLEGSLSLKSLSLAWNGLENEGAITMGQILVNNASLVSLDLTNTRLGSEACVMLGEGIKANTTLEELLLNGNAIGDDGARHLMAALKSNKTLECLSLQGSNMSTAARGHNGAAEFNPLAPEGSYTLALDNPTDRAVAAQLCKFDLTSAKGPLMHNIKVDDQSIKGVREMDWPAKLPSSGLLEFDFVARKIQNMVQVMDNKKFTAVVFQLESKTMADVEKLTLVEIIAPFTYLYCHQIASILRCFSMGDEVVRAAALLFTRAADLEENLDALTSALQDYDILSLQQMLGWFSYCRFSNPTGHYEINLTTPVHQAIAVRLKDVAYGEPNEGSNWFNIVYDMYSHAVKVPSNYGPPDFWKGVIPTRGTVSFDYVSTTRPPPEALPIGDEELLDFLHEEIGLTLNNTGSVVPEEDYSTADMQLALLRQEAGHRFWFTCAQVLRMMGAFLAGPHKVEVAVMMWALILDRKDFWTILYSLPPFEQALLMWRLGPLNVLDKAHPSAHYVLDLSNNLHEQVARRLVDMAAKNPDVPNFWNLRLQGVKKVMPEGSNMWGSLTTETFTPWLEFDFIYHDAWDNGTLGKTRADAEAMGKFDKLEVLSRQAKRLEMQRIKAMYGYFYDGSGYAPPLWRTRSQMFKALIEKSPWLAAWDRMMRLLVRLDLRSGDIQTDSYIEDIFGSRCSDEGDLPQENFEAICRDWGYTKGEIFFHYRRLFEVSAKLVVREPHGKMSQAASKRSHFSYLPSNAASRAPSTHLSAEDVAVEKLKQRTNSGASNAGKDVQVEDSVSGSSAAAQSQELPPDDAEEVPATPGEGEAPADSEMPAPLKRAPSTWTEGPVLVLDFPTFVSVFMQEPPPDLRFKEVPTQTNFTGASAMKAKANSKRALPAGSSASRPHSPRNKK